MLDQLIIRKLSACKVDGSSDHLKVVRKCHGPCDFHDVEAFDGGDNFP